MTRTEIVRTGDNGTRGLFFEANPTARGVAPQTWAAEVTLMQRFTIGFQVASASAPIVPWVRLKFHIPGLRNASPEEIMRQWSKREINPHPVIVVQQAANIFKSFAVHSWMRAGFLQGRLLSTGIRNLPLMETLSKSEIISLGRLIE